MSDDPVADGGLPAGEVFAAVMSLHRIAVLIHFGQGENVGLVELLGDFESQATGLRTRRLGLGFDDGKEFLYAGGIDFENDGDTDHGVH